MNGGSSAVALAGSANRHSRFTLVAFDTCTPAHSYDKSGQVQVGATGTDLPSAEPPRLRWTGVAPWLGGAIPPRWLNAARCAAI